MRQKWRVDEHGWTNVTEAYEHDTNRMIPT